MGEQTRRFLHGDQLAERMAVATKDLDVLAAAFWKENELLTSKKIQAQKVGATDHTCVTRESKTGSFPKTEPKPGVSGIIFAFD